MTAIMPKDEAQKLLDGAGHNLARDLEQACAERDAYREAYEDTKRLSRELDVAMHGEDGAAKQASLCDLVNPARQMRDEINHLAADNARLAAQVEALAGALKEAGDYLEACKVNGLPDLGAASRMPFLDDVIANVDAALTLAAMTPAEQADYDLTMRIRGAAGDIAKKQIAAREDGE